MNGNDNDIVELVDEDMPVFEDPVAQRAYAFVHLAKFAEACEDQPTKDLTFTMMRKLSMSIKTPSTAELKVVEKE
jgi:hypothetical protein